MESVIRSDLLPVSALCFDFGEVVDERGRNRSPWPRFLHLLIPVSMHVEGTGTVASNEVGQPKIGLQVMMIFNWLPLEQLIWLERKRSLCYLSHCPHVPVGKTWELTECHKHSLSSSSPQSAADPQSDIIPCLRGVQLEPMGGLSGGEGTADSVLICLTSINALPSLTSPCKISCFSYAFWWPNRNIRKNCKMKWKITYQPPHWPVHRTIHVCRKLKYDSACRKTMLTLKIPKVRLVYS